ncbi:hypothetical protein ACFOSV_05485 [Algoriphagus namhaensis]|uniref:Outer membrane protein beta-barrel domain-containing protein n=1 Tax=Algoriphagus namhaensis TaxID=915353 RepID=A0ABV8ASA6_9BACT
MKKIYLFLFGFGLCTVAFGQSGKEFWFGLDASYWQKSIKSSTFFQQEPNQERFGSVRPMIGLKLNQKWDVGIMVSVNSYIEELSPLNFTQEFGVFDEEGMLLYNDSRTTVYQTTIDNQLFGVGIFARRNFQLNEKFSFNLSPYILRESGDSGVMNFYFPASSFYPCINCLSIFPGPIEVPTSEENWRFGVDAAFAYQATNWMKLEIRANLLEFRRQTLTDERNLLTNDLAIFDPFLSATQGYFDSYTDFGSAVTREGIRFGLVFSPF